MTARLLDRPFGEGLETVVQLVHDFRFTAALGREIRRRNGVERALAALQREFFPRWRLADAETVEVDLNCPQWFDETVVGSPHPPDEPVKEPHWVAVQSIGPGKTGVSIDGKAYWPRNPFDDAKGLRRFDLDVFVKALRSPRCLPSNVLRALFESEMFPRGLEPVDRSCDYFAPGFQGPRGNVYAHCLIVLRTGHRLYGLADMDDCRSLAETVRVFMAD